MIHAVILAGGQGQRLGGVRKAELRIGGVRLIDRVAGALGPVAPPLLVATGPEHAVPSGNFAGVADLKGPVGGPLAGLVAVVDWLANRGTSEGLLVSVSVDTPFLPADFAARLQKSLGGSAAAYARWGNEFYPPNALWQLAALQALPNLVRAGTAPKSLKALLASMDAVACDWHDTAPLNPFENLNTLADLVRLGRRAKQA